MRDLICLFEPTITASTCAACAVASPNADLRAPQPPQPAHPKIMTSSSTGGPIREDLGDKEDSRTTAKTKNAAKSASKEIKEEHFVENGVRADLRIDESDTADRRDDGEDDCRGDDVHDKDDDYEAILAVSVASSQDFSSDVDSQDDLRRIPSLESIDEVLLDLDGDDDVNQYVSRLASPRPYTFSSYIYKTYKKGAAGTSQALAFGEVEVSMIGVEENDDVSTMSGEWLQPSAYADGSSDLIDDATADISTDLTVAAPAEQDADEEITGNNARNSSPEGRYAYAVSLSGIPEDDEACATPVTQNRRSITSLLGIDKRIRRNLSVITSTTKDDCTDIADNTNGVLSLLLPSPSSLSTASIGLNSYNSQEKARYRLRPTPRPCSYDERPTPRPCSYDESDVSSFSDSRSCYSVSEYGPHTQEEYALLQSILSEDSDATDEQTVSQSILREESGASSNDNDAAHNLSGSADTSSSILDLLIANANDEEDWVEEDEDDECSRTPSLLGVNSNELEQRRQTHLDGMVRHTCVLRY